MQTHPNANYIPLARVGSARLGVGSARLGIWSTKHGVGFLDSNMLVSPMQNCRFGGLNQPNTSSFVSQWNIGLTPPARPSRVDVSLGLIDQSCGSIQHGGYNTISRTIVGLT